ncbi:TPA: hypothetical protein DEP96_02195 [Candidatus Uhrbacteria bacterium]|nr:hypothetical protein [Candidatus Uhrbacteria bacterium]
MEIYFAIEGEVSAKTTVGESLMWFGDFQKVVIEEITTTHVECMGHLKHGGGGVTFTIPILAGPAPTGHELEVGGIGYAVAAFTNFADAEDFSERRY